MPEAGVRRQFQQQRVQEATLSFPDDQVDLHRAVWGRVHVAPNAHFGETVLKIEGRDPVLQDLDGLSLGVGPQDQEALGQGNHGAQIRFRQFAIALKLHPTEAAPLAALHGVGEGHRLGTLGRPGGHHALVADLRLGEALVAEVGRDAARPLIEDAGRIALGPGQGHEL